MTAVMPGNPATAVTGAFGTFAELMEAAAAQLEDHEAYVEVDTGRRLTFGAWHRAADIAAARLAADGVRPGDVVAIALPPSIDYAIACAAVLHLGAVATGINTRLGRRETAAIVAGCRPRLVIEDASALRAAGGRRLAPSKAEPDDPAVIIWTSGTTGLPKGAWFDHRNLAAAVRTAGIMTQPLDRRISGVPMAHAGYMAKLWEQCAMGVTLVLTPNPWTAESMLDVLVGEHVTVGAGVPTQWAKLLELPQVATADLTSLRICLAATAPAPPELVAGMRTLLRCPVVVRYAMTESPSITGTSPDDPPEVQYRTVGKPQVETRIDLVDARGDVVPYGEVGRVRVEGPCVMRGYWSDAAATRAVLDTEGRLLSTDLGRLDDDGNLILVGRASDMYIRGGYNVYPLEVENVLTEHPSIASAAVVGVERSVIGEIGVAFVVLVPGAPVPSPDSVRTWVSDRLADYKAPDEVRVVDALPLTAMGKVDKGALAAAC
jgi:acyl-CoA synthetase (AMP-forming)/AMP-acid ligase II